ncbi:MAG: invasion associated locus B family protein [Pseudomonadota bacterium]
MNSGILITDKSTGHVQWLVKRALSITTVIAIVVFANTALAQNANNAGHWKVDCANAASGVGKQCQLSQVLTAEGTGQHILSVVIRPIEKAGKHSILFALPHGLQLPVGIALQVDGGKVLNAPIQTSDAKGVYSNFQLSDGFFKSMKAGANLRVSMKSIKGDTITLSLSLLGFTAGAEKLKQ